MGANDPIKVRFYVLFKVASKRMGFKGSSGGREVYGSLKSAGKRRISSLTGTGKLEGLALGAGVGVVVQVSRA
jgi:hypothetical protein